MFEENNLLSLSINPFDNPRIWRQKFVKYAKLSPKIRFNGKGFICALINSRCPIGCEHCMFASNMSENKSSINTMTKRRISRLMKLVRDSNTGYLLVSGGGEGFIEPELMYQIVEETRADITWMVTGAHWAVNMENAVDVVNNMYNAYLRGGHRKNGRIICLRISLDSYHVEKIAPTVHHQFQHVLNLVKIFDANYAHDKNFVLMIHALQGEEELVEDLCKNLSAENIDRHNPIHDKVKVTEYAFTLRLKSGYEFEVTFAKLLLSDLAADLRDKEMLDKRIKIFEKDAFQNERGYPAIKYNADGKIGPNMLVLYNGRVAGGWQSEMPDVPINIDFDDFDNVMEKTLSDPGVVGTIERGLKYRFDVIQEVCPKAVLRSKAVNVRDYTSPVLLEEDKVKLYYTIRVLQDYLTSSRISKNEIENWPPELQFLISLSKDELQMLYREANYDIIQQFIESDKIDHFGDFVLHVKQYAHERESKIIREFFASNPKISKRTIDKWYLLLRRIVNDWYDICTFNEEEIKSLEEVSNILDKEILEGKRIYEGLSLQ